MELNLSFSLTEHNIPLSTALPWNIGAHYSFFWISYIAVLCFAVILNAFTFVFINLNVKLRNLPSVQCIKYLVLEDLFSALVCLIQCCFNYHVRQLFGDSVGCTIEAWQVGFFITITGYTLGLISYLVRVNVTTVSVHRTHKRRTFIFKVHLVFWLTAALFTTFSTVWPGSSRLNSSGTYCIAAFEKFWPALFFFGVAVFPTVLFLTVQYTWIFIFVYNSKKALMNDLDVAAKATMQSYNNVIQLHFTLARQLGTLVLVYFICYLPFMGSAVYEWCTGYYAPPIVDGTGVLVHIASVANPLMYLWASSHAKKELWKFCVNNISLQNIVFHKTTPNQDDQDKHHSDGNEYADSSSSSETHNTHATEAIH